MQNLIKISLILFALVLSGCSFENLPFLYRPDVQQGNLFTPEMVHRIKPGMNENQVRFIMGNPVLINTLSIGRMEYVYTFRPNHGNMNIKRAIIYFNHGIVTRIQE